MLIMSNLTLECNWCTLGSDQETTSLEISFTIICKFTVAYCEMK